MGGLKGDLKGATGDDMEGNLEGARGEVSAEVMLYKIAELPRRLIAKGYVWYSMVNWVLQEAETAIVIEDLAIDIKYDDLKKICYADSAIMLIRVQYHKEMNMWISVNIE